MEYIVIGFFVQNIAVVGIGVNSETREPKIVVISGKTTFDFCGSFNLKDTTGEMFDYYGKSSLSDVLLEGEILSFGKSYSRAGGNVLKYVFRKRSEDFFDGSYTSIKQINGVARCMIFPVTKKLSLLEIEKKMPSLIPEGFLTKDMIIG